MPSMATLPSPAPACVPGCTLSHDVDLGFRLCDAPVATVPADAHRVTVSASRVLEDGQAHVTVAVSIDGREPLELDPATAVLVATAIARAANLAASAA